jgi:hypothetical protein
VGEVSGPGLEPSCLCVAGLAAGISDGVGTEIDAVDASVVANNVVGSSLTPAMGPMLSGKILESMELLNNHQ